MRALVTGASRGLGQAIASHLSQTGAEVIATLRQLDKAVHLGNLSAIQWRALDLDVLDQADAGIVKFCGDVPAGLDAIVLNAASTTYSSLHQQELPEIHAQIQVALTRQLQLLATLISLDKLADKASVVFIGSNLGQRGLPMKVAYSAAKSGLEGATRALAHEYGPRGWRFNTVAPGLVRTDMTHHLSEAQWREYEASVPLRRAGCAQDVAQVVGFLVSPASSYVTGQVIAVDGGWSI